MDESNDPSTPYQSAFAQAAPISPATPELREYPFSFHGNGAEYFRIWIVNVMLTAVTLGIYLPWARVRTRKYFYGNTLLNDRTFDYLARPTALLKGYLIVTIAMIVYNVVGTINPLAAIPIMLIYICVAPWLIYKSLRFKCHNSAYANVRLRFVGSLGESFAIYLGFLILIPLTFGLIIPYQAYLSKKYMFGNLAVGQSESETKVEPGKFYLIYLAYLIPIGLVFLIGMLAAMIIPVASGVLDKAKETQGNVPAQVETAGNPADEDIDNDAPLTAADADAGMTGNEDFDPEDFDAEDIGAPEGLMIAMIMIFYVLFILLTILLQQFVFVRTTNYTMTNTTLGSCRLHSDMRARDMIWITVSNVLLCIITLGIFIPWAIVRLRKYRIEHMKLFAYGELQDFIAAKEAEQDATGDAAADFLDFELGF